MLDQNEKFLLVKGKAGLGNRMLSAVTAILYGQLSARRLVIDWSDVTYSSNGSNVFPELFGCPNSAAMVPDTDSISPALWRNRLDKTASQLVQEIDPIAHDSQRRFRKFSVDLSKTDYPETILIFSLYNHRISQLRRHFKGEFANLAFMSDDDILRELFQRSLILNPGIRARVSKWRDNHFVPGRMLGVHVRFMERRTSIDWFFRDVDRIFESVKDPVIFLATDNRNAEDAFKKRYKNVISTEKWFPTSGISMHQNPECPDKLNNAIEALMDMYLLAECNYLVFPGSSTFSYVSSLLSHMPSSNIIDVERNDAVIQLKKIARRLIN